MSALDLPPPDRSGTSTKPRLLLVENEPALRQLLTELLRAEYELLVAPDGERAWELAAQELPPDLVLSDVKMPGIDGIELTRRLRTQALTAIVPILLFTADNRLATLLEGLEAGPTTSCTNRSGHLSCSLGCEVGYGFTGCATRNSPANL